MNSLCWGAADRISIFAIFFTVNLMCFCIVSAFIAILTSVVRFQNYPIQIDIQVRFSISIGFIVNVSQVHDR
jgi:hypothetical protein